MPRKVSTFIVKRKNGFSIKKHGKVHFRVATMDEVVAILEWFDPVRAAEIKRKPALEKFIQQAWAEAGRDL